MLLNHSAQSSCVVLGCVVLAMAARRAVHAALRVAIVAAIALLVIVPVTSAASKHVPAASSTASAQLKASPAKGIDVVLVLPAGRDVAPIESDQLKKMIQLTDAIHKLIPTARIGIVFYGSAGRSPKVVPLSTGFDKVRATLVSARIDQRSAVSDNLLAAIQAAKDSDWKPGWRHVVVMIGVRLPSDATDGAIFNYASEIHASGGIVNTVDASPLLYKKTHQTLTGEKEKKLDGFLAQIASSGGGALREFNPPPRKPSSNAFPVPPNADRG